MFFLNLPSTCYTKFRQQIDSKMHASASITVEIIFIESGSRRKISQDKEKETVVRDTTIREALCKDRMGSRSRPYTIIIYFPELQEYHNRFG